MKVSKAPSQVLVDPNAVLEVSARCGSQWKQPVHQANTLSDHFGVDSFVVSCSLGGILMFGTLQDLTP